jgi:hypothetical protein
VRAFLVVIGLLVASHARADAPEPPCPGCTLDVPESKTAMPLLVVLHGDHETAAAAVARWKAPALARGWAVLGIQCPEKEKLCRMGQWYMFNPKPSWIEGFVATVESKLSIDSKRIYLAGWSGGSTYIGMRADKWTKFAAVVFHGGGRKPLSGSCPKKLPAYFLMSATNYFFKYTKLFSEFWKNCKQDRVWDLHKNVKNHVAEGLLLDEAKANEILDWLAPRTREPTAATPEPAKRKRT